MHAVWSAIVMKLSSVCLSVCPPVCEEVYCGAQGQCSGLKMYRRVSSKAVGAFYVQAL